MYSVKISEDTQFSKVAQIVNAIIADIDTGTLPIGARLPSINKFSQENKVGRDTIEKAYRALKRRGYISSFRGRGYFVLGKHDKKLKVLLIFNKLSSFKKIVYDVLVEDLGSKATVDLQIHHYDPHHLREILEANLGKYHYYVIMPHFFSNADVAEWTRIIKMVPSHELILLDKNLPQLSFPHRAVYQDFRSDVYQVLKSSTGLTGKYDSITLVFPEDIHHPKEIIEGIKTFCKEQGMKFYIMGHVGNGLLRKHSIYIVTEEDDLGRLIKNVRQSKFELGKDVGIISFNETVFKELLDITVITTDFTEMGHAAARLILNKECVQYKNPFYMINRGSL